MKASLYYLKVVQESTFNKLYPDLFKLAVQLVLFTTTRVLCNEKNSDDIIKEVTDKVRNCLKVLIKSGTTKICQKSLFNVQHRTQGPLEAKVWKNLVYTVCIIIYVLCI